MIAQIPTSSQNTSYRQVVTLSGQRYTLSFRYNTRMSRWILDVADGTGVAIVSGIVMLLLRDLTGQYSTLRVPPGLLFCLSTGASAIEPTLASFLTDTQFLYNDGLPS